MVQAPKLLSYLGAYDYDSLNRLIRKKASAAEGGLAITRYVYDNMGNLVKEVAPNDYDEAKDNGSMAATMAGMGYAYDSMNRRIFTYSPDNEIIQAVSYDGNGNVKKVSDGLRYTGDMSTSPGTEYTTGCTGLWESPMHGATKPHMNIRKKRQ